ncbi:MAG: DsbA family protein [Desulfobacteraceae bacterium]|nr:DsbA family protein [Desulfobacteraceae bacterium]
MAANRQGKFWPMHDKIFESYQSLNEAKLSGFAKEIGLDMAKFDKDIADPKLKEQVVRDQQEGIAAGVRGTPTLFVNGRQVRDRSLEGLKALVGGELQHLKARAKP